MTYAIDIGPAPLALLQELPRRSCACVFTMLEHLAELAVHWALEDPRWEQLVHRDAEGLHFYVDGCCVRLEIQPDTRCLVVREIGRVLVHLPPRGLALAQDLEGSLGEQRASIEVGEALLHIQSEH